MTIQQAIKHAADVLEAASIPDPLQDSLLILSSILGLGSLELRLNGDRTLNSEQEQRLSSLLLSRTTRQPLQYLLSEQCFYGLDFYVDHRVLIPRQETETLCELGLAFLKAHTNASALDLCTGSGAIATTLKHEVPLATVTAIDLSEGALEVAKMNAKRNGAEVRFLQGDLLEPVCGERFDLILSNPPYIKSLDCDTLQPEVMLEPRMALDGGDDGYVFYRRIAAKADEFLAVGGMLAVEVGDDQAKQVAALFTSNSNLCDVHIHRDLYGHERIVCAHASSNPT
ncbi:MAG: peptide chain release factor N(5)-glutamine methyltransferase [Clostridiales bacterium]|nr:peptide chain release factor N(5)-glutamine methyltransferase [Clostridiales bacterium]